MPERGTLVSFTVIRKPPAAFADDGIYAVAVVDTPGGRVTARLEPFEPEPDLGCSVELLDTRNGIPVYTAASDGADNT